MSVGYRALGTLEVALDDDHARVLAGRAEKLEHEGLPVQVLDGAAVRALEPGLSEEARGALFFADEASLDPRPLARAVYVAASRAGATFVTGEVRRIADRGGARDRRRPRRRTDRRRRGGARGGELEPARRGARAPSRRRAPRARPESPSSTRGRRSSRAWSSPETATSCRGRTGGSCAARRWRTWAGRRRSPPVACATCSRSQSRSRPPLAQAPVVETWSNFRPASPDGEPILGEGTIPGLFYATGHTRNGILLAPITADAIAAAVTGGARAGGPVAVLARAARRHPRPPLRRASRSVAGAWAGRRRPPAGSG